MKYIIIGMHGSGKQEVIDILENKGVKCGKQFTNLDHPTMVNIYNGSNYEQYSQKDIIDIFENNAYIFLQEFPFGESNLPFSLVSAFKYYEGLSLYEFENNDVFVLSPDQLFSISSALIKDEITFIWLDNPKRNRLNRYYDEKRTYNFYNRESIESKDSSSFVKFLYSFDKSNVLYFTNEEPSRVAAIIFSLIQHPDLLPTYIQAFN